ncbi:hypothetical protein [Actinotalea subterranea]|uniref:hypothetical protein n=1 Tax=Actinotalea subterranea TaxID=2607497 RepID=UPI0011ED5F1B|nr:hypothetical protein [Actinotalea subterranea]
MPRTSTTVLAALVIAATLTGCSAVADDSAPPSETTTQQAPAVEASPAPTPTPEPAPEPVADEFSQVVNGVLFQGTEKAPVRIGTDVPGQPPVVEAQLVIDAEGRSLNAEPLATDNDKYILYVFSSEESGGWIWKVFGMSRHGSFRDLENNLGAPLASADAAIAGAAVDGRILDRAEYILMVVP